MQILPIHYNYSHYKPLPSTSFKSSSRIYTINPYGTEHPVSVKTLSVIFRDDINWLEFARLCHSNFSGKNKVNTYSLACADGAEPYTFAIALKETSSNTDKFFPIMAIDQDEEIIKAAKSGRINLTPEDISRLDELQHDHTYYFTNPNTPLMIVNNSFTSEKILSYKPTENLTRKIVFQQGDILNTLRNIKDDENSIILCRNVAPYLTEDYQRDIVETIEKVLKKGSLFVVGSYDFHSSKSYICDFLDFSKYFQQIEKHIYRRI